MEAKMKLVRKVAALAKRRRDRQLAKPLSDVGLVWTSAETKVDRAAMPAGSHIATDVVITDRGPEFEIWSTVERFATDPEDLGVVYDQSRTQIGRVSAVEGKLLTLEIDGDAGGEVATATPR
jgi:hypothetical protein